MDGIGADEPESQMPRQKAILGCRIYLILTLFGGNGFDTKELLMGHQNSDFCFIAFDERQKSILAHGVSPASAMLEAKRIAPCFIVTLLNAGVHGEMIWNEQMQLDEARRMVAE